MPDDITVYKHDHEGREVWHYSGKTLARDETHIQLEAYFNRDDIDAGYVVFRRNDRFIEWFYSDRWYNIFEIHDVDYDHLKGWYCNISRPALISDGAVRCDDLALDLWVSPEGHIRLIDEDEFDKLELTVRERGTALRAVDELRALVAEKKGPFGSISGD